MKNISLFLSLSFIRLYLHLLKSIIAHSNSIRFYYLINTIKNIKLKKKIGEHDIAQKLSSPIFFKIFAIRGGEIAFENSFPENSPRAETFVRVTRHRVQNPNTVTRAVRNFRCSARRRFAYYSGNDRVKDRPPRRILTIRWTKMRHTYISSAYINHYENRATKQLFLFFFKFDLYDVYREKYRESRAIVVQRSEAKFMLMCHSEIDGVRHPRLFLSIKVILPPDIIKLDFTSI